MDSYFKKLKRPELYNYSPDQSFGANMAHGSEEQNPWANRDQSNAKFGRLGGSNGQIVEGPSGITKPLEIPQFGSNDQTFESVKPAQYVSGGQLDPSLEGKVFSLPSGMGGMSALGGSSGGATLDPLNSIMGAITKPAGEYLGKTAYNWLNPESTMGDISTKLGLASGEGVNIPDVAGRLSNMGDNPLASFDPTMGKAGDAFEGITREMTKGSTDALESAIEGGSTATDTANAIPYTGAALKLFGDIMSGKLFQRPAESIGGAGGALAGAAGGAAAGTAVFPGIGTALGGALGALLGGKGGGLLGRTFGRIFR